MVVQVCRLRVQREMERRMTPKLSGALEALKRIQSFAEDEGDKLTKRITSETEPMLVGAFKELRKSNGGDPLDGSEEQSNVSKLPPRSSEVANR